MVGELRTGLLTRKQKELYITVRAMVAVEENGAWCVLGASGDSDSTITEIALTGADRDTTKTFWITANIPIEVSAIQAKIEPNDKQD